MSGSSPVTDDGVAPCPFCGSAAFVEMIRPHSWIVSCLGCATDKCDTSKAKTIAAWNTRVAASDRDVLVRRIAELAAALELAVPIIEEERESTVDCHTVLYRGSPDYGKVVDAEAVEYIATYDAALKAARAALIPLAGELQRPD